MSRKKKHQYKSEAEYQASEQLHKFKIKFEYEPFKIEYEWREDKKYIPDFVLPNGVILEVKGKFMLEDRKKHLFIKKQHPEHDIRFVFQAPNNKLHKGGRMTYAEWCERYGFRIILKFYGESLTVEFIFPLKVIIYMLRKKKVFFQSFTLWNTLNLSLDKNS